MAKTNNPSTSTETLSAEDVEKVNAAQFSMTDFDKAIQEAVADFKEEQIGFPPYWSPDEIGDKILCKPILFDNKDENFPRYVMICTRVPLKCFRGPADNQQEVVVKPGEMFTMSPYAALPLDRYYDIEVYIQTTGRRKLPGNEASEGKPRDLWEWKLMVSKDDQKLLNARRADETKRLQQARQTSLLPSGVNNGESANA